MNMMTPYTNTQSTIQQDNELREALDRILKQYEDKGEIAKEETNEDDDCLDWKPAAEDYDTQYDYDAKYDFGKPDYTLVPTQIIDDIEQIRQYGVAKYHDADNWKLVERERYFKAFLRHVMAMLKYGMDSVDKESGLLHSAHAACNLAFMAEMRGSEELF